MTRELTTNILLGLRELRKETQTLLEEQSKTYNISMTQLLILDMISKHPDSSLHQLAKMVNLSPSTTSEVIEKMVKADLVIREKSEINRRAIKLSLTEKGETTLVETYSSWIQEIDILDDLGEERLLAFYETQLAIIDVLKQRRVLNGKHETK